MSDITTSEQFFNYDGYPMQFFNISNPEAQTDFIFVGGFSDPVQNHFDIFEELVKKGYRVWALNMPGHGKSAQIENVDWDMLVKIVRTFIDSTEIKEYVVGGFSMGGGVAIMYAGEFPENVKAIRVLSPFCYGLPSISKALIGGARFTIDFLRNKAINPSNKPNPSGEIYPLYYIPNYSSVIRRSIKLNSKALREIPIDIVVGMEDEVVDPNLVKEALHQLHHANFREVEGLGHDIYFIEPRMIEEIVENLVK